MVDLVSVHGGHSGEFCGHAVDSLSDIVEAYVDAGFRWVCLTEHMPPHREDMIAADESAFDLEGVNERFRLCFAEARRLQAAWAGVIDIYVGFETEAFSGYGQAVDAAMATFRPDMIVGSVHHVGDVAFDYSATHYRRAIDRAGGIEAFYCAYFDQQLELIEFCRPEVVGHFDLVRILDPDYRQRWDVPSIRERAYRNLDRIAELDLVLDYNVRALQKGQPEPYVSEPWLSRAVELGIAVVPGDDSHGVATVGSHIERGVELLRSAGACTEWRRPGRRSRG